MELWSRAATAQKHASLKDGRHGYQSYLKARYTTRDSRWDVERKLLYAFHSGILQTVGLVHNHGTTCMLRVGRSSPTIRIMGRNTIEASVKIKALRRVGMIDVRSTF